MVSKTTKKGLVTAGVGVGGFLGGMAVGYFGKSSIDEALAPGWAKDVVNNITMSHPATASPRTIGLEYLGTKPNCRGETTAFYAVWSYTNYGNDIDGWIEIVYDEELEKTTVYYRLEVNMTMTYGGIAIVTTLKSVPYGKFEV